MATQIFGLCRLEFGVNRYISSRSIRRFHIIFRKNEVFPHPNPTKAREPRLLVAFPEVKEQLATFCREQGDRFTVEVAHQHLTNDVIPKLVVEPDAATTEASESRAP